ncbi:MAG: hypothetical protein M0R21_08645 [Lentimicrobiaceae bacterium]|nr:hypothetical protein [Lentimicrobiaceae bacterium]
MEGENRISLDITQQQVDGFISEVAKLKSMLPAGLVTLTSEERHAYAKMGDKTIAFVEKALDYGRLYPHLVPAYINLDEMEKDVKAVKYLLTFIHSIEEMNTLLDDSILLAGSEAYIAALSIYASVKDAAKRNVPGAKPASDDLKERFSGRKAKTEGEVLQN